MGESREREREEREREREEREREREERERERERYRPRSPVSRPTARPATLFVSFSAWSAWRQHQHPRSHSHCCCCLLFVAPSSFLRGARTCARDVSRDSTSVWRLALLLRSLISCVVLLNGASQPVLFLFTCDPLVSRCTMESLMNPRERTWMYRREAVG